MTPKQKKHLAAFVAVTLALVLLAISIGLTQAGQGETVTDYTQVPPKGAGLHDRD